MTSAVAGGRFGRFIRHAAHVGADAAILIGSVFLAFWAASKAAEADQRPPVVGQFDGHESTFTNQFTTTGPWQVSWQGDLDIQVWMNTPDAAPVQCHEISGENGSAFFADAGTFFFVVAVLQASPWSITVRSR
ncbi:MAG TPA: hypothetical protein VEK82_00885 [Stellaceae bacterium]|nr:hypothetical protein [Stellaceae bacterium]